MLAFQRAVSDLPTLVEVRNVKKHYPLSWGLQTLFKKEKTVVKAVDGVSFAIHNRETLALVGESGCGKTTLGKVILGLLEPTDGRVYFMGRDISDLKKHDVRILRKMQAIFQNPYASVNPRKNVYQTLELPLSLVDKGDTENKIGDLLRMVGLDPLQFMYKYPHELSGGEMQRVTIARAIASRPEFIVADEPVSSLDISIRAHVINLLKRLQESLGLGCLYITHDLALVRSFCSNVAVMYLGRLVECATVEELYKEPLHPYTKLLISSTPIPDPRRARARKLFVVKGDTPSPIDSLLGCRFHARCPYGKSQCEKDEPEMVNVGKSHYVACYDRS